MNTSTAHDKKVKLAESKGYYITDFNFGQTTMVKTVNGSTKLLYICHDTGEFLGANSI